MNNDRPEHNGKLPHGAPDNRTRSRVATIVKVLLTVALLVLIVSKVSLTSLIEGFLTVDLRMVALGVAISAVFTLTKAFKWHYVLRSASSTSSYGEAVRTYLIGISLAVVTPGRVGELGRAYFLRDGDRAFGAGLVAVDRLVDLAVVFVLACAGAFAIIGGALGATCLAVAIVFLGLLYWPEYPSRWASAALKKIPSLRRLETLPQGFRSVPRRTLTGLLALTFLCYGLVLLQFYVLLSGFEQVDPSAVLLVFPLVMLTNIFQFTIGGLGIREGTSAMLLAMFGVSKATAVDATFMMFLFNILTPGLIGALLFARRP